MAARLRPARPASRAEIREHVAEKLQPLAPQRVRFTKCALRSPGNLVPETPSVLDVGEDQPALIEREQPRNAVRSLDGLSACHVPVTGGEYLQEPSPMKHQAANLLRFAAHVAINRGRGVAELVGVVRRLRIGLHRDHQVLFLEPHIERPVAERRALVEPLRPDRSENPPCRGRAKSRADRRPTT